VTQLEALGPEALEPEALGPVLAAVALVEAKEPPLVVGSPEVLHLLEPGHVSMVLVTQKAV